MKPRIAKRYYTGSRRGFWTVSPVPKPWRYLTGKDKERWEKATRYVTKLNVLESRKVVAQQYIDKYGLEGLRVP